MLDQPFIYVMSTGPFCFRALRSTAKAREEVFTATALNVVNFNWVLAVAFLFAIADSGGVVGRGRAQFHCVKSLAGVVSPRFRAQNERGKRK